MTRLLLIALLAAAPGLAQVSEDPNDQPETLLARIKLAVQRYQENHPDSREAVPLRRRGAVHFINMDGTNTLLAGDDLTREDDNGNVVPAEPLLYTTRGGGWVRLGTGTNLYIRNTAYGHMVEHRWRSADRATVYTFGIGIPELTRVEGPESEDFTFTWANAPWTLTLENNGVSMRSAPIATRRGAVTHSSRLNWNNWTPAVNADGDIAGDIPFIFSRPVMVGADGSRTPCGPWVIRTGVINGQFTCDDSALPDAALPYYIDPETANYSNTGLYTALGWAASNPSWVYNDCKPGWQYTGQVTRQLKMCITGFNTSLSGTINSVTMTATTGVGGLGGDGLRGGYKNDATLSTSATDALTWWINDPTTRAGDAWFIAYNAIPQNSSFTVDLTSPDSNINKAGQTAIRMWPGAGGIWNYSNIITITDWTLSVNYTPAYTPTTGNVSGIPANFLYGVWFDISATVSDQNGYADISYWHLLINYGVDGAYACYLLLTHNGNYIQLLNDVASDWGPGYTMGSATYAANSQCQISLANSSFSVGGNNATANLRLRFMPGALVRNPMNAYLWVTDATAASGWAYANNTGYVRTRPKLIITSQH